jgi:hypothetical protein
MNHGSSSSKSENFGGSLEKEGCKMNNMDMETIENIIPAAIDYHLGNITNLPESAQIKIHNIYKVFYSAYLNIAKLKGLPEHTATDDLIELDGELIEYMRHFFSDYQIIYREFVSLNRQVRELMQIDQQHNPQRFEEGLNTLVTGKDAEGSNIILEALLKPQP